MVLEAETVTDAMEELRAVAAGVNDTSRRRVHVACSHPRAHGRDRRVVPREHELVDLFLSLVWLTHDSHPRRVGLVAFERPAEIEQHQVAWRELAARRLEVGLSRVRTRLDERAEGEGPAEVADRRRDHERDVDLRLARPQPGDDPFVRLIRDVGRALKLLDLVLVLDEPQATELRPDVDELGGAGT